MSNQGDSQVKNTGSSQPSNNFGNERTSNCSNSIEGELVAPPPEHCPGPESTRAGTGQACEGCPNQMVCSSGAASQGGGTDGVEISRRLERVERKILIMSGKGGVGKSTLAALLAYAFSACDREIKSEENEEKDKPRETISTGDREIEQINIGLIDADITGPSISKLLGLDGETIHVSSTGWTPLSVSDTLQAISIQNMLPPEAPDTAVIWRGAKKTGIIRQFLRDVDWGPLDLLLIDTPPGTSDEHLALTSLLKDSRIDGAVIISTAQEVALLDVKKQLDFCKKAGIPILGLVENMSSFVCCHCSASNVLFPSKLSGGGVQALAVKNNIPFLASIPIDPRIVSAGDIGSNFLSLYPESPATQAIFTIVKSLAHSFGWNLMLPYYLSVSP